MDRDEEQQGQVHHDQVEHHHVEQGRDHPFAPAHPDADLEAAEALLLSAEGELLLINEAITALGAGTFGRCEVCNEEVELAILREHLDARRCAAHTR